MAPYLDLPTPPEEDVQRWPTNSPATSAIPAEAETVAIGGNDTWLYSPSTNLFDLSRGSERGLTLRASPRDAELHHHGGVRIDPAKTCVVVVDMQNYFIHPSFHQHAAGLAAVEPIVRVLQKSRKERIQVAWLNWVVEERDMLTMPPAVQRCFNAERAGMFGRGWGVNLGAEVPAHQGGGRVLWKGSWNAEIYGPLQDAMCPGDVVCHKNRMSGMWHQDEPLRRFLRSGGFQTLVFAGINTDMCLLGTMTDAYSAGFDVIMLRDCTGTATKVKGAQELVENNVAACMGFVLDSVAFLNAEGQDGRPGFVDQ